MVRILNSTEKEFRNILRHKKIICLCGGDDFRDFIEIYKDVEFECLFVLDNDRSKSEIEIEGKKYRVRTYEGITDEINESLIVLTSKKNAECIVRQIDDIEKFNGKPIYIPRLFEPDYSLFDFVERREELIPRKIHYCWFGEKELPEKFQRNIYTWRKHNPDYEIIKWDENNYDVNKNEYIRDAYKRGLYAYVSDYVRLDVVHKYGGIYLDVDVEVLKSWDKLLQFPLFCGFEHDNKIAFGLGYGAVKGNTIIRELMNEYEMMKFPDTDKGDQLIPCPVYQTALLIKHGLICDGMSRDYGDFLALSLVYFASENNSIGIGRRHKESFSIHHYEGSWLDEDALHERDKWVSKYQFLIDHMI